MGFTFAAFSYVLALILDAFLIFFSVFHVSYSNFEFSSRQCSVLTAFAVCLAERHFLNLPFTDLKLMPIPLSLQVIAIDELKTDFKNPIDQCNTLNPVIIHSNEASDLFTRFYGDSSKHTNCLPWSLTLLSPSPAGAAGVHHSHLLQRDLPVRRPMVGPPTQSAADRLSHSSVR